MTVTRYQRTVLDVIELYAGTEGMTAYEIINEVQARRFWAGPGSVYPRLYALVDMGLVEQIRRDIPEGAGSQPFVYRRRY